MLVLLVGAIVLLVAIPVLGNYSQNTGTQGGGITYNNSGTDPRARDLSRITGQDLSKMSPKEVRQYYIDHAKELGVMIYENTRDSLGREIPKLLGGDKVKNTAPASAPLAPTAYPAP